MIGTKALRFNHTVQINTIFIQGKPVLHMIDLATHFCAARFLKSQTTETIRITIQILGTLVFMGPPDDLSVAQMTAYVSKKIKQIFEASGIAPIATPIEPVGSIGTVERY